MIIGHTTNGGRWADDETGCTYVRVYYISPVGVSRIAGQVKVYPWITSLLYFVSLLGTRARIRCFFTSRHIYTYRVEPGDLDRIKLQRYRSNCHSYNIIDTCVYI